MRRRFRVARRLACGFAALAMVSTGAAMVTAPVSGATAGTKTVATWAETPGSSPNYIFPFVTFAKCSTANLSYFQWMMYRPLYLVGNLATGTTTDISINKTYSLADTPVWSNGGKTVTISLKPYKWSDGESVDATDVMFYLNMLTAAKTHDCYYLPGGLAMPTSIADAKATGTTTVVITLNTKVSEHWFDYDELTQITPMPLAWTKSSTGASAGSGGCAKAAFGTAVTACKAVFDYLSEEAGFNPTKPTETITALPTYATNPLWQVVDGPWHLTSFGPTAPVVMKPNPTYSGPNKPKLKEFIEEPYTTTSAEFNALVGGTVDDGYLPLSDVTSPATPSSTPFKPPTPGKNNPRLSTYSIDPDWYLAYNYAPINFNSTGDGGQAGPIFRQLYFRQALQYGIDEAAYIKSFLKGYAVPLYGPEPSIPKNPYVDKAEASGYYVYNPAKGVALLKAHGWKVTPNGTDTCEKPGTKSDECGKGIHKGAKASFTYVVYSSTQWKDLASAEKSSWASEGIQVRVSPETFDDTIGTAVPCASGCSWEMAFWGAGWVYVPNFYPTGTETIETGAGGNAGSFSTKKEDALIKATNQSTVKLTTYENYTAKELPVLFQPGAVLIREIHKGLKGVTPFNVYSYFTPATWSWSS